ncbi:MAG: c-type cytochrome [Pirellulaceae bacterium]|nr:c-type cytochrome [Pirellulaceae bacterium]
MLLLDAIENKRIPVRDVSADQARQILALDNASLAKRLGEVWGSLNSTPRAKQQKIASLKNSLSADFLLEADLQRGRTLFNKRCAACHRLFGEGQAVAPELTGSGRRNLDYLLNNIVDPNAVVPADFRVSVILLDDGRVITGSVISMTERRLTVQNRTESVYVLRSRIETIKTLPVSLMPEELLKDLSLNEVRDLVGYMMSDGPTDR